MAVVGVGGIFFRANDPEALQAWYGKHLGVGGDDPYHWVTEAGPTVFMPFPKTTDHFPAGQQAMINYRVADLDGLLASLRDAGVEVSTNPDWDTPETGRFAHIHDPEGNRVELWEPPAE